MENILTAWIPIALGILGSLGGAAFAYSKFAEKLRNKKLGIIGLSGSGKTTLAEYLVNNKLPEKTSQTLSTNDYKDITLKDLGIKVDIVDTRANYSEYAYELEKKLLLESDIIFYLFDISKLFSATEKDKYFKRIRDEIKFYCDVLNSRQEEIDKEDIINVAKNFLKSKPSEPKEKIFIALGTFYDKLELTGDNIVSQFSIMQEDIEYLFKVECKYKIRCFNSLVDKERIEETVNEIFKILKELYDKSIIESAGEAIGNFFEGDKK